MLIAVIFRARYNNTMPHIVNKKKKGVRIDIHCLIIVQYRTNICTLIPSTESCTRVLYDSSRLCKGYKMLHGVYSL